MIRPEVEAKGDIRVRLKRAHAAVAAEVLHNDAYLPVLRRLAEAMKHFALVSDPLAPD